MIGNVGPGEILVILLVVLLVFGSKRIPEIARGMGTGIREFRGAMREIQTELNNTRSYPSYSTPTSVARQTVAPISPAPTTEPAEPAAEPVPADPAGAGTPVA